MTSRKGKCNKSIPDGMEMCNSTTCNKLVKLGELFCKDHMPGSRRIKFRGEEGL